MTTLRSRLFALLTTSSLAGVVATLVTPSVGATEVKIECSIAQNVPVVVANSHQQQVTILQFLPKYFSAQAAVKNCQQTAQTLQTLAQEHNGYLTSDLLEDRPVVCTVTRRGKSCDTADAQVLFALAADSEPHQAFYEILGNKFKPSQPLNQRTVGRIYTKIDRSWWEFWRF